MHNQGEEVTFENYDQTPLHMNEVAASGKIKTWDSKGEKEIVVKQNWAASRNRYTLMCGVSSNPIAAPPGTPEVVFKGAGRAKYTSQPGISSQWAPKGSYREEHVVHFIKNNLRQNEDAVEAAKWKVLAASLRIQ